MFSKLKSCSRLNLHRNLLKMDQANLSNIKTIVSSNAPKAIGPYSQGKIVNSVSNLVYTSGSIGINPEVILFKN